MSTPFIVMCAPNGARKTKDDHPAIPITPAELAKCAVSIADVGASIMHVHVRDDKDLHSLDAGRYREAITAIRDSVDDRLIIQVTTEACGVYTPAEQMRVVRELNPEAVSVALREFNPDQDDEAANFYRWLSDDGIFVQHILYSAEDVRRFESLRDAGIIADRRPFVLFVLGRYTSDLTGDIGELPAFIDAKSRDTHWAVCSFGNTEEMAAAESAKSGGHVRVGFENNLELPDDRLAPDNAALVTIAAAQSGDRPVATSADVREMFGIGIS